VVDLPNSFVLRQGQLLKVDFYRLLRRGDMSQNIYLQSDDLVYLRPATARNIYVLGAVPAPNVLPFSAESTLLSAIATVGGTVPYAYESHVAIIRGSLTEPRIAIVDYKAIRRGQATDVRLAPGDIVYVPFAPYRRLAIFAEQILAQFVQTIAINEGNRAVLEAPPPVGVSVGSGVVPTQTTAPPP
jgi:protein involved in polysaccharide export with SLBB domain